MYQRLLVALIIALSTAPSIAPAASISRFDLPASYCLTDIGQLPQPPTGTTSVTPAAINNHNQIVGSTVNVIVGRAQAFIWDQTEGMRALGVLPGHDSANANDINDAGQVVGTSSNFETGAHLSFIWDEQNGMQELDASLGGDRHGATGINRFGEVSGSSTIGGDNSIEHGYFLDKHGDVFDLGTVSEVNLSTFATALNDLGKVVGLDSGPTFSQAFIWDEQHGLQPFDQPESTSVLPNAINNKNEVVGLFLPPDRSRPFLWTKRTGFQDLGSLGGNETDSGEAHDINRWGTIVGWSQRADLLGKAFVWNERSGMRSLEEMVDPTSPLAAHARLNTALAINDLGWIVIEGHDVRDTSVTHTYLLAPRFPSDPPCQ